jgi:hypothetical protein
MIFWLYSYSNLIEVVVSCLTVTTTVTATNVGVEMLLKGPSAGLPFNGNLDRVVSLASAE